MADFAVAIPTVLQHEDPGLTGDIAPDRNGALVRYGVNQADNPNMPAGFYTGALANGPALDAAKACYEANYWTPILLGELQDQGVAGKVLDMAVNMGTGEAPKLLQRAVNAAGGSLTVDGMIGPATIAAANAAPAAMILSGLRNLACQFYRDLAAAKPADAPYLEGWLARARS